MYGALRQDRPLLMPLLLLHSAITTGSVITTGMHALGAPYLIFACYRSRPFGVTTAVSCGQFPVEPAPFFKPARNNGVVHRGPRGGAGLGLVGERGGGCGGVDEDERRKDRRL